MGRDWLVVRATGTRLDLECGAERLEVARPKDSFARQVFMGVRPGQTIDDGQCSSSSALSSRAALRGIGLARLPLLKVVGSM